MPRFFYKAVTASGEVVEGELEARDRQSLIAQLQNQGHVPIRAEERSAGLAGWRLEFSFGRGHISDSEIALLIRELSILLRAGLALDRALSILAQLARRGPHRRLVETTLERLRAGETLADAMAASGTFAEYAIGLVRAGEAGGTLETVLERLAESLERRQALKEQVRSALQYPLVVMLVAGLSLAVLVAWVIPSFQPLFDDAGAKLPLLTQMVIAGSDFLRATWWAFLLILILGLLVFQRWTTSDKGRLTWDRWRLTLPLVGELQAKLETARITRTLGTLLVNGVTALDALAITAKATGNKAFALTLEELRTRMAKGQGLATPMAESTIFPPLAVQLVQVGEESGQLDAMLLRIAEIFEGEARRTIQRLLALLVPLITIALGIVIAVIIGSMLVAILSTYDLPF